AATNRFKALSRNDLDYWASPESAHYLTHNKRLIDQHCAVERVFLLPREQNITPAHQDALRRQLRMGISVRIAYLDSCKDIVEDDRELDFGLFDGLAVVSFWRFSAGRVFRLSTSAAHYRRYSEIYERVVNVCIDVPGKGVERHSVFDDEEQLAQWCRQSHKTE